MAYLFAFLNVWDLTPLFSCLLFFFLLYVSLSAAGRLSSIFSLLDPFFSLFILILLPLLLITIRNRRAISVWLGIFPAFTHAAVHSSHQHGQSS